MTIPDYPSKWDFANWIAWYRERNPSKSESEAIGFTLFQTEMNYNLLIQELASEPASMREVEKRGLLPATNPRHYSEDQVRKIRENIRKWMLEELSNVNKYLSFQIENACYENTDAYRNAKAEYTQRIHDRSRHFHAGKQVWFPWGISNKYPADEIEAKHADR